MNHQLDCIVNILVKLIYFNAKYHTYNKRNCSILTGMLSNHDSLGYLLQEIPDCHFSFTKTILTSILKIKCAYHTK